MVGENGLASFLGSALDLKSDLPFYSAWVDLKDLKGYQQYDSISEIIQDKGSKFVFLDQRDYVKKFVEDPDGYFIKANYQKCPGLPLMIASRWFYLKPGFYIIN